MRSFIRGPFHIPVSIFFPWRMLQCLVLLAFSAHSFPRILPPFSTVQAPRLLHIHNQMPSFPRMWSGCLPHPSYASGTSVNFGKFCFVGSSTMVTVWILAVSSTEIPIGSAFANPSGALKALHNICPGGNPLQNISASSFTTDVGTDH